MSRTAKEVLENMTDFELSELYYMNQAELFTQWSMVITLAFGYVLVAYFAGKQLTRIQVTLVSVLYSGFILSSVFSVYGGLEFSREIQNFVFRLEGERFSWRILVSIGGAIAAWVLSLVYMYQARKGRDT